MQQQIVELKQDEENETSVEIETVNENVVEDEKQIVEEKKENSIVINEETKEPQIDLALEESSNETSIQLNQVQETKEPELNKQEIINEKIAFSSQTETEDELPDLIPRSDDINMSDEEQTNDCIANKTAINDITLKAESKPFEETESESLDIQTNQESSQQSEVVISKTDLNDSINSKSSKSSVLIDCTLDQDTIEDDSKDVNDSTNTSFDLNLNSISANNSPSKLIKPITSDTSNEILPPMQDTFQSMSRQSSVSSLFSHISSVSQQYERNDETDESKPIKKITRRRIQPSSRNKDIRHMDDNELSIKKANEEIIEGPGKASLRRRKSDISSTSSSASSVVSTANLEAVAKLRANLQQIPSKFGSNDQEVRVTRSKLRSLIEPAEEIVVKESKPVTRTRSARTTKKHLEQLSEETTIDTDSQTKMSISNLKKHNAAYDKLDSLGLAKQSSTEVEEEIISVKRGGRKTTRTTTTRSPSPTASSIVSESTVASVSQPTKTRTRGKAKPKQEKHADENDSPTESLVSVASTASRYSMRERRGTAPVTSAEVAAAAALTSEANKVSPSKAYGLRSKGKTSTKTEEIHEESAPGQAKVKRTRSKALKNTEPETHKLEAITEAEIIIDDSEDVTTASQEVAESKPTRSTRTRRVHK